MTRPDPPPLDLSASVELLRLACAAGLSPRAAVRALSDELGSGAGPVESIASRLRVGAPFHAALFHDIDGLDPSWVRVLRVLERADLDGLDPGPNLDAIAADMNRDRLARLDVDAQRLSVKLLFPLVLCILPAFLCLSMVPLVLEVFHGLPR